MFRGVGLVGAGRQPGRIGRCAVPAIGARVFRFSLFLFPLLLLASSLDAEVPFRRGDINVDGHIDIGDIFIPENFLWDRINTLPCVDAADADDDGHITLTDTVWMASYLFLGGSAPLPPGPDLPGVDPTPDDLDCAEYDVTSPPRQGDFSLGFEEPPVLEILAGVPIVGEAIATLTSNPDRKGGAMARGWSISLGLEGDGIYIADITTDGTVAAEAPEGLRDTGFEKSEIVDPTLDLGSGPQGPGAVSSVILSFPYGITLPPLGTERIARISLDAGDFSSRDDCQARLFFVDGKKGSGQPVRNVIYMRNATQIPELGSTDIECVHADNAYRPGDCNQDNVLDLSDAICLLGNLYLGVPERLPCGDGSPNDSANIEILDSNGDHELDLSDAVYVLRFLFLGTDPPYQGEECIFVTGPCDPGHCR